MATGIRMKNHIKKEIIHRVIWRIGCSVSFALKKTGGAILDLGWHIGDSVAKNHYLKTREGIAVKESLLRGEQGED